MLDNVVCPQILYCIRMGMKKKKKNGNEIGFCLFFLVNCLSLAVAAYGFSLVVMSGSYSSAVCRLLIPLASRCRAEVLGPASFSSCSTWALDLVFSGCVAWT